jgi:two-component system sensor histidine kinase/response regulator
MKKILIIEDELAYSKLLQKELEVQGYQVLSAENGIDGLELATQTKPDLILLDIRMPKMDGMTMLSALRRNDYGATAKVIILTNLEPDNSIINHVVKDEPVYYCVKSDTKLEDLLKKIADLLSKPTAASATV